MASMLHIAKRRVARALTAMIMLVVVGSVPVQMVQAQPASGSGGTQRQGADRRHDIWGADTNRFQMMPFSGQEKLYRQTYTHEDLFSTPVPQRPLYVMEDPATSYCADRVIKRAMINARLAMGPNDYEFDTVDFSVTVELTITPYTSGGTALDPYKATLVIGSALTKIWPEQIFAKDFTALYSAVDRFQISIDSYTFSSAETDPALLLALKNNVSLDVWYTEEFLADAVSSAGPTAPVIIIRSLPLVSKRVVANPVKFEWDLVNDCVPDSFPNYQIQVLRLFNRSELYTSSEESILDTIDWSRALTVETGNSKTSITLTIAEGTGYYVWRVRPIGTIYPGGIANDRNWGPWSVAPPNGEFRVADIDESNLISNPLFKRAVFFYSEGDRDRNWIYNRTFTEGSEGTRISEGMTYATGLLQSQQTQAHLQSQDSTLVSQTVYDYSGRPSLATLPAPIAWSGFAYRTGFIKAGASTSATLYTAEHYDQDANSTNPSAVYPYSVPAAYYSDENSNLQIPNAEGYPFTRVRYYPDATGRVLEQSGAGSVFRIGGGAETVTSSSPLIDRTVKTYYSQAADAELVAMFGDEAPADTTVQKIITVDPNKVATVKYVSKEGQTLATALVKLHSPSKMHLTELTNETAVFDASVTKSVGPNRRGREFGAEASTTITLIESAPLDLHYEITPSTLESACTEVCSTCDYVIDILVVPAEDPGAPVFTKSYTLPAAECSTEGFTLDTATATLPPGSYTVIRRIRSGGVDDDGLPVREALARAEAASVRDAIDAKLVNVREYLDVADLNGLYEYLETLRGLGQATYDETGKIYKLTTSCCIITIPVLECDPDNPCGGTLRDFEGYLYKKWGSENYAYNGDPEKNFGDNLDKYFYDYYPWVNLFGIDPVRFPDGDGHKGQFNKLIEHMIESGLYDCNDLWTAWKDLVDGFGYMSTSHHQGDPDDRTYGYNLLNEFLRRVGTHYEGASTCQYGDCGTQPIDGDGAYTGFSDGYLEYAYKSFRYNVDNAGTAACRAAMGWTSGGAAKNLIVKDDLDHSSHLDNTLSWTTEEWTNFHACLFAPHPAQPPALPIDCQDPTSEECIIAMRDALVDTCTTMCERKRPGFTASVVNAYHAVGKTVEGDRFTPDGQPIDEEGHILDENGDPTEESVELVSLHTVDCQVSILVQHCGDDCSLSLVRDGGGKITSIGTTEELATFPKAMAYSWRVAIPQDGICPDTLESISSADPNRTYARSVVAHLNGKLRALRLSGGDTLSADSLSRYFHGVYVAYTGSTGCGWDTDSTSHHEDNSECCPPIGLPQIFTLGPRIVSSYFALDSCTLVYVRVCKIDSHYVTQREILCDDICLEPCATPICFAWVPMTSPETTAVIRPYSCEELKTAELRRLINEQTSACIDLHAAQMLSSYSAACGDPASTDDALTVTYPVGVYHFTLYYYDRAGHLVRTVPPRGVVLNTGGRSTHPSHTLYTSYEYNSLGQLIRQRTPDAGITTFHYDSKGRQRFVRTAEQTARNAFSYTKYDALGRAIETGEGQFSTTATPENKADDMSYPNAGDAVQVYQMVYTTPVPGIQYEPGTPRAQSQRYLRNRVSYTRSADSTSYTFYSYDPHGNVEWLAQDIQGLGLNYIRYDYDLISNKVLGLYYNEGLGDQLLQRYAYDEDNRITRVESSRDGTIWDRDASYSYYLHGPLRRAEYGEDSLQGVDYTHTLQGWLKGVNHASLLTSVDPGRDGNASAGVHSKYAADAFGMSLTYYEGDFLRKYGTVNSPFNSATTTTYTKSGYHLSPMNSASGLLNLYNGNIATWTSNMKGVVGLSGETYVYDRLNRLLSSTFNNYGSSWISSADFRTTYSYDPNGNILTLVRNQSIASGRRPMDDLKYWYPTTSNRLLYVDDAVASGVPSTDMDDQSTGNYTYDASGRLTGDAQESISQTEWSPSNKVLVVTKTGGVALRFSYDAQGNRIKKITGGSTTYYVREASGKVIAIYHKPCVGPGESTPGGVVHDPGEGGGSEGECLLTLAEQYVYGSGADDRVATIFPDKYRDMDDHSQSDSIFTRVLRQKEYELHDHLGNVRVRYSDMKRTTVAAGAPPYVIDQRGYLNYYPFGMEQPGRSFSFVDEKGRYGYNGKEKDDDWNNRNAVTGQSGEGNSYDYGFRMYNPRLGRFLSEDPLAPESAGWSPYASMFNNPVVYTDPDGRVPIIKINEKTKTITLYQPVFVVTKGDHSYDAEDLPEMAKDVNAFANNRNYVGFVNDGRGKGDEHIHKYKINVEVEYFEGGTEEETANAVKAYQSRTGTLAEGMMMRLSVKETYEKFKEVFETEPGEGVYIGGITLKNKIVFMNERARVRMTTHEMMHLMFANDRPDAVGVMARPEEKRYPGSARPSGMGIYTMGPETNVDNIEEIVNKNFGRSEAEIFFEKEDGTLERMGASGWDNWNPGSPIKIEEEP